MVVLVPVEIWTELLRLNQRVSIRLRSVMMCNFLIVCQIAYQYNRLGVLNGFDFHIRFYFAS